VDWIASVDVSIYSRPRRFQDPFSKITEVVAVQSVLWAFIFGPFFYWRKRAGAEAVLMALSAAPLLQLSHIGSKYRVSFSEIPYVSAVLWVAFAVLAPVLLVMHYRRKGWVEVP
jgi:hypothetical protein